MKSSRIQSMTQRLDPRSNSPRWDVAPTDIFNFVVNNVSASAGGTLATDSSTVTSTVEVFLTGVHVSNNGSGGSSPVAALTAGNTTLGSWVAASSPSAMVGSRDAPIARIPASSTVRFIAVVGGTFSAVAWGVIEPLFANLMP